jgi:restriction system protein
MKNVESLSPTEFEKYAKNFLEKLARSSSGTLESFEAQHLEELKGSDGEYKIDVTARFRVLEMDFLVLGECKHLKRPVEREDLMVLWAKQQSLNAHKCILFSISGYQEGALAYAQERRMALLHLMDGQAVHLTRSATPVHRPASPAVSFWLAHPNEHGKLSYRNVNDNRMEPMKSFFH